MEKKYLDFFWAKTYHIEYQIQILFSHAPFNDYLIATQSLKTEGKR